MDNGLKYKEYKSSEGSELFDLDNFSRCNYSMCNLNRELRFIELPKNEAQILEQKYQIKLQNINIENESQLNKIKQELIRDLKLKNYNTEKLVEPIIHD